MAAKKNGRREKKAGSGKGGPERKLAMGRQRVAGFKKHVAKELALGPLERANQTLVDAARRLWLSAEGLHPSQVASARRPMRKARVRASR